MANGSVNGTTMKWVAGVAAAVTGGVMLTWIIGIRADVSALKIDMAKTATAAEVAALRADVRVLNERVEAANRTLLRLESASLSGR